MTDKPSTIRLSPERRAAIDDVRHASVSRQAWVDAVIDRALEATLGESGRANSDRAPRAPAVSTVTQAPASPRAHGSPSPSLMRQMSKPDLVVDACISCRASGSPNRGRQACSACGYTGPKDPGFVPATRKQAT